MEMEVILTTTIVAMAADMGIMGGMATTGIITDGMATTIEGTMVIMATGITATIMADITVDTMEAIVGNLS